MRNTWLNTLFEISNKNKKIIFIGSDLGFNVMANFKKKFPKRFFMEGISEQNIVGTAAGMALRGFIPYVNTISTFITRRCYEQVAIDLCLHNLPVKLIANGGGLVYAPLGPTHLAIEDLAIMRALPNMNIVSPSDAEEMKRFMSQSKDINGPRENLNPLLDLIIKHVKPTNLDKTQPFAMLSTLLYADNFLGRSLVGKIAQGTAKANQQIKAINLKGEKVDEGRLTKIFRYEGTKKVPIQTGEAGDIVIIAGLEKANVADTICDLELDKPISATPIDPPTMSITITVNSSPLAGTEGKKLTSTQIRERLILEAENNVGITFEENSNKDSFVISGRGELMLEILLTQMRREGFEMTVSPPKVLIKEDSSGKKQEPIEEITMDLDEEYSSKIIDSMNRRKGKLVDLKDTGKDKKRLIFHAPTRGLMGYTSRFLTLTKGTGVINRIFHSYGDYTGEMEGRRNGALISIETGKAVAFAIFNLQARGEMLVTHNDAVYEGMIVGISSKAGDLEINVMKGKKLTNMRTQNTDENVVLTPVRKMAIAEQLSLLNTDEALEITPKSCRLRKLILDPHERKRLSRAKSKAS